MEWTIFYEAKKVFQHLFQLIIKYNYLSYVNFEIVQHLFSKSALQ